VWISAEVVETDVASTESGTIGCIRFEVLLRIALDYCGYLLVIRESTGHRPLPDRRY